MQDIGWEEVSFKQCFIVLSPLEIDTFCVSFQKPSYQQDL